LADENLYSLLIRVEGGDVAAAEIIKSKYALKQVADESKALRAEANSPFEHAGVYLFSRQLFGLVGLSDLARHALSGINVAVEATASSFGLAMSTVGPLLLAIGAGVAIYESYEKSAGKASKAVADLAQKQEEALKSTIDYKDAIAELLKETGQLPENLRAVAFAIGAQDLAQRRLVEHQKGEVMAANQALIISNKKRIEALGEENATLAGQIRGLTSQAELFRANDKAIRENEKAISDLKQKNLELNTEYEKSKADITAIAAGHANASEQTKKLTEAHKAAAEAARKHGDEEKKAAEEIRNASKEEEKEIDGAAKKQEAALERADSKNEDSL
jgi:hypothetical protein